MACRLKTYGQDGGWLWLAIRFRRAEPLSSGYYLVNVSTGRAGARQLVPSELLELLAGVLKMVQRFDRKKGSVDLSVKLLSRLCVLGCPAGQHHALMCLWLFKMVLAGLQLSAWLCVCRCSTHCTARWDSSDELRIFSFSLIRSR